jgi:hypothetical protein
MDAKRSQNQNRQIITQSQLKFVMDWGSLNNKKLTLKEIVAITNVMVDYVEHGYSKEIGERLEKIEDHLNNKVYPIKDSVSFNIKGE